MVPLKLPDEISGKWNNALFLSYGVDLAFFERSILPLLGPRCNNVVIVADGDQLVASCQYYAENASMVRWVNQKYLVDGVFAATFHPKCILLTTPHQGRLFIGSGNLNLEGYAGPGEMFARYDYASDQPFHKPVFCSFWRFLLFLTEHGLVGERTKYQIQKLTDATPWLHMLVDDVPSMLRTNLRDTFLEQIKQAFAHGQVAELHVLSPFYDRELHALRSLLKVLSPQSIFIYLQENGTSLDRNALIDVIGSFDSGLSVRTVNVQSWQTAYLHNKLYIIHGDQHSVCVQGSANMSQQAFLRTALPGNFEIVNWLEGDRHAFDDLLSHLAISQPVTDLSQVAVEFRDTQPDEPHSATVRVMRAEWRTHQLVCFYSGGLPVSARIAVECRDGSIFDCVIDQADEACLILRSDQVLSNVKNHELVIRLVFGPDLCSNYFFPINNDALDAMDSVQDDSNKLGVMARLDLEDEELEELLQQLDNALILDTESVSNLWHSVGSPGETSPEEEGDTRLRYEDIDFDLIKRNPKYLQYCQWRDRNPYRITPLQVILHSINAHFLSLRTGGEDAGSLSDLAERMVNGLGDSVLDEYETEEEALAAEEEKARKQVSMQRRISNLLKRFFRRYLEGFTNPRFLQLVDCEVMAMNFVIINHILWRLTLHDWCDYRFLLSITAQLYEFMWGTPGQPGYFVALDATDRSTVLSIFEENHTFSVILAMASAFALDAGKSPYLFSDLRFQMRNALRSLFQIPQIAITADDIHDARRLLYMKDTNAALLASDILSLIYRLLKWESKTSFLRAIESRLSLPERSLAFAIESDIVSRGSNVMAIQVKPLLVHIPGDTWTFEFAVDILRLWHDFEHNLYYRLRSVDKTGLAFFDTELSHGLFYIETSEVEQVIDGLPPPPPTEWEAQLLALIDQYKDIDQDISLPVRSRIEPPHRNSND
jgi:hypothetical protein